MPRYFVATLDGVAQPDTIARSPYESAARALERISPPSKRAIKRRGLVAAVLERLDDATACGLRVREVAVTTAPNAITCALGCTVDL